jgi:hypothetical protein
MKTKVNLGESGYKDMRGRVVVVAVVMEGQGELQK